MNFILLFLFQLIIIFISIKLYYKSNIVMIDKSINNVQKIHVNPVPRFGGVCLFIGLISSYFFRLNESTFFLQFLVCMLPMLLISFYEDVMQNTTPKIRLLGILISSFTIIQLIPLPNIDLPLVSYFLTFNLIKITFFAICMATLINGFNVIDGSNGVASTSAISAIVSVICISIELDDYSLLQLYLTIVILLITFMLFNYPWGKIFLGDSGAYMLGYMTGVITIYFYARHEELPFYGALLILFYPLIELIFSFFRKIITRKNPLKPDEHHLHLILYRILFAKTKNSKIANNLMLPLLFLLTVMPSFCLFFIYNNVGLILYALALFVAIYFSLYKYLIGYEASITQ